MVVPPCASFSAVGKREKGWGVEKKYSDTTQRTDDLFYEYARLVKEIQPKVFVAENVKGLTIGSAKYLLGTTNKGLLFGDTKNTICKTLINCGYNVYYQVLNAKHFGVPQARERLIIVGVRNDINKTFNYPEGNKKEFVSLEEAFSNLNQSENELAETNIEKYKIYDILKDLPIGVFANKILGGGSYMSLIKSDKNTVSYTFTQMNSQLGAAGICHWDNRKFTVKEAIRIMSFPDDYYLGEKYKDRIERLGRAVPPLMMKAVAEEVYKQILSKI